MKVAFLGLGRMGRILAGHLVGDGTFNVTVWNRTPSAATPFAERGTHVAATVPEAIAGAEAVITCLFGPDAVRQTILDAELAWPDGACWIDITTVGPAVARECADWAATRGISYVHAPVLGSLGPAQARDLGVLIGGTDPAARAVARTISSLWADPQRVVEYDTAAKAAIAKLEVNYGLAVGMEALIEAYRLGIAGGLTPDEALAIAKLPKTPLSVIAGMKGAALSSGDYTDTQFSTNLLVKDVNLMLTQIKAEGVPALVTARARLVAAQQAGHGEDDFSAMAGE